MEGRMQVSYPLSPSHQPCGPQEPLSHPTGITGWFSVAAFSRENEQLGNPCHVYSLCQVWKCQWFSVMTTNSRHLCILRMSTGRSAPEMSVFSCAHREDVDRSVLERYLSLPLGSGVARVRHCSGKMFGYLNHFGLISSDFSRRYLSCCALQVNRAVQHLCRQKGQRPTACCLRSFCRFTQPKNKSGRG